MPDPSPEQVARAAKWITKTVGELADMGHGQEAADIWRDAGRLDGPRLIAYAARLRQRRQAAPWLIDQNRVHVCDGVRYEATA